MFAQAFRGSRVIVLAVSILFQGGLFSLGQSIPPPQEILGFEVGADYHLASYQQALEYFRALEQASPMLKLFEMGKTSMGKPMVYAVITSAENMAKLDRLKEISRRLALANDLTDEEARTLAAEGRAVVYIDGGLHATEVAPSQHNLQLAYDLLTSDEPGTRLIRENAILLLNFANPDGMDMVAEWYRKNLGTPFETTSMPWLYHHYAGHDNNRDSFMLNLPETQNIHGMANREWYPLVLVNHHQTAPFPTRIFIPPVPEPLNPNVHPLVTRWKNQIGSAMGTAFDRKGQTGAISRIIIDAWSPDMVDSVGDLFHTVSICPETALYRYATPHFYTVDDFPEPYRDFTPSIFYPSPWRGGWWRLKDAVEYVLTCSKSALHTTAKYREEFLFDRYKMGKDVITRFQNEPPYAWIIPQAQWDPPTAALMLNKMMKMGIKVYQSDESFVSGGVSYPARTWVIPMSQSFALYVKTLFEEQSYPDLKKYPHLWQGVVRPQVLPDVYLPPYDVAGWTLPYQMGVKVSAADSPMEVGLTPLETVVPQAGKIEGEAGYAYLLSPKINNSFIAVNRVLEEGGKVLRAKDSFQAGGKSHLPGTWIVIAGSVSRVFMDSLAKEFFLNVEGTSERVSVDTFELRSPRVALYQSWTAPADEGWTRWLFEQFELPFTTIQDEDVKAGELGERFDVLIIPSMSTEAIINGHEPGTMPPQYVGGITRAGVVNIKSFVEGGGTLVTLNTGSSFAISDLGLPLQDALKDVRPSRRGEASDVTGPPKFTCPNSLVRMEFDTTHPISYGMPEEAAAVFTESLAFGTIASFDSERKPTVAAKYSDEELLLSGFLEGEKYLQGEGAVAEVPLGRGKVLLLGFGVQHRGQPHGTFKLLFNSLYYGSSR